MVLFSQMIHHNPPQIAHCDTRGDQAQPLKHIKKELVFRRPTQSPPLACPSFFSEQRKLDTTDLLLRQEVKVGAAYVRHVQQ